MIKFLQKPIARLISKILVFLMVIQGFPFGEIAQHYKSNFILPDFFQISTADAAPLQQNAVLKCIEYDWGEPAPGFTYDDWPIFEGWMHVLIENPCYEDVFNVTASLSYWPENNEIIDGDVTLGDIPGGNSVWSEDTFRIRTDMSNQADPYEGVLWTIEYDDAEGSHHIIENVPEFPIEDDIPPSVDIAIDPLSVNIGEQVNITVDANDNVGLCSLILMINDEEILYDNEGNVVYVPQEEGEYTVKAIATDADGNITEETATFTAGIANTQPVADAGPDQAGFIGDTITFDGSGSSDADGDQLTYSWSFVSMPQGSGASLSDPASVEPTFEIDEAGTYVIQLIVNDGLLDSEPDTVAISTENRRPVANAGPDQTVLLGDMVTLDGSGSYDADGDLLTFSWSFVSMPQGSSAVLSDSNALEPTFEIDEVGTYVIQLIVNDGLLDSEPDTVTVSTENRRPVANAGPAQTSFVGSTITLDGSGSSDVDGDILTFSWSFVSMPQGSSAALSDPNAVEPTFEIDEAGTYVIQLIVNDGLLDSEPDTITISTENRRPVANAGPDQTSFIGSAVTLDGSGSYDVDGDLLTFTWSFVSIPQDSEATLSDPNAVEPTFTVDEAGTYVVQLIVNDGLLDSEPDTVIVSTENRRPVANAGPDQSVFVGDIITLDGSGSSDADGDILTFSWSFVSMPEGSTAILSDPTSENPTFVVDLSGNYVIQLIVNDGIMDSDPDSVVISTQNSRPVADAGADQDVFIGDTVILDGSGSLDVDNDPLSYQWSFTSVPEGSTAVLSEPTSENPTFLADLSGTYVVQLIVNDGDLDSEPDSVVFRTINRKPLANAGNDRSIFTGDIIQLDGSMSSDPDNDPLTYTWQFISMPPGSSASLSNPNIVNPIFMADLAGSYVIQLIVNDGTEDSDPDAVTFTASEANEPPEITSSPVTTATEGELYNYDVEATDPNGDVLTFYLDAAPAGMSINSSTGLLQWTPGNTQVGENNVTVRAEDPDGLLDTQSFTITVASANQSPVITSIPVSSAIAGELYAYDVEAEDQDGDILTYSLITAPAGMNIEPNTGVINWTPAVGQTGSHNVEVEVSDDRGGIDSQLFAISVTATGNHSPQITSTAVTSATTSIPYQYDVEATDEDGFPLTFSLTEAPDGMTIDIGTGLIEWTPDDTQIGDNNVAVTVEDAEAAFDTQSFIIAVSLHGDISPPEVNVYVDPSIVDPDEIVTISVDASDDVEVVSLELNVNGTPLALDVNNQATFSSDTPGLYTAEVTAYDAEGNTGTDNEDFRVLSPGDITLPVVNITSPGSDSELTSPTEIVGTASDDNLINYTLEYSPKDQNDFVTFAEGDSSVADGVLGTLDTTTLINGLYDIRLTAEDANGNWSSTAVVYRIKEDLKVGNFTVTFQDLSIPVAGIPITINRTYDSRDKGSHDFGYGWSIDIQNIKVKESCVLGSGWDQTSSGGWWPTYCIQPNGEHYVSITLPDGRSEEFNITLSPQCQQLVPIETVTVSFSPRSGTFSSLTPMGDTDLWVMGGVGSVELLDWGTLMPYDPDEYQLTTPEGMVYVINQNTGIKTITDQNGNTLTYGSSGIIHSTGKSVVFTRDSGDRITQITDPNGGAITYEYDSNGDLVAVIDQEGNTTRFGYNSSHGLVDIEDPRGITPARNIYDDEGRLIAHIDAYGNRIEYTHNVGARQEVVKDRLGNISVYEYDDNGNVLSKTDPLGNTTLYTYDERGNKLTETCPLGETITFTYDDRDNLLSRTDPLGNTTTYTYNSRNQVLTSTDPLGNVTSYTYDANGNLLTTTDPLGNTSTNTYDASGSLLTTTGSMGNVTAYEYDASGNMTRETDALGNVTIFNYDANGNQLSQTTTRTTDSVPVAMTTTKEYDSLNRLVKTIDPDGNSTAIEYNAISKKSATIDKNGNRTEYQYDLMGNLIKTTFPDGTIETATYDAVGNKLTSTDRAGRTTRYEYDALKRVIEITFPDGSSTSTEYDAAGRLIASVDEIGNRTSYVYDSVGRRTEVIDALGNVTSFVYDAKGNKISMTDANGNTTSYEYDNLNRLVRTNFPAATFTATAYDSLGRKISQTDQAGITTQFEYDALGRLIKVIDALGGETAYSYDEIGNKLTQTDPNGHTTIWEYDNNGRITKRTLPLGMSELFTYDANGNMLTKTDFNGNTITYLYNVNNQLITKTNPDSTLATFTYNAMGQRNTVTDARGATSYSYDLRGRLTEVVNPDGTSLTYAYDSKGNRRSVTIPSGATTYTYDELNRLEIVTNPDGGVTTYTYDNIGNRSSVTYPNGTVAEYTYNNLNRLTNLLNRKNSGEIISSYTYTLGPAGNRTRVVEDSGRTVDYAYDNLYRLTQENITDPVLGNDIISYTYDAFGDRLTKADSSGATNYTYDANDRLLTETAPAYTNNYTYNNNGNTISKSDGAIITSYSYDYENRLVEVEEGGSQIAYEYDADGIRTKSTIDGAVTDYLIDKNRNYAQVLEERDDGGSLIVSYIYGDDLISQKRSGSISYYHYDGHMSTRKLTEEAELVTDSYVYDAFGILLNQTGSTTNNYLYTGEQYDPNVGFYYLRARYNNQNIGRFLTQDPFNGDIYEPLSLHRYIYANANPINYFDPSGMFCIIDLLMTTCITGTLQKIYAINLSKALLDINVIAYCILEPAFIMRHVAFTAIAKGYNGWPYDMERESRMIISQGYSDIANRIGKAYLKIYEEIADKLFNLNNIVKQALKISRINANILGNTGIATNLQDLENEFNEFFDFVINFYQAPTENCKIAITMRYFGNKVIGAL